jgi:hypothetical protein
VTGFSSPTARRLLLIAAPLALIIVGCGGNGGDTTVESPTSEARPGAAKAKMRAPQQLKPAGEHGQGSAPAERSEPELAPPPDDFTPKLHQDSGGGSDQFRVAGGDNSIQEFGDEADLSEFESAAALHNFLDARAERNWAAACSYLAESVKQGFAQLPSTSDQPRGCAVTLVALSGRVPASELREAAVADVGSLRTEGDRAFLIYRGAPKGTIYAIQMAREGDAWKVASLGPVPLS